MTDKNQACKVCKLFNDSLHTAKVI